MRKPIRILHVLGRLDRGGAETMIMNLYRNIDRTRVQFDFIIHTNDICDYDKEIYDMGGRIYKVPRYSGTNHFSYIKMWQSFFVKHSEYKIIHGHIRSTASIYLTIAKKYGLITIAHSHSTASRGNKFEQWVKKTLQTSIRFKADYLFACSKDAGQWLFGKKAIKKSNYREIKNAIDVEKYKFNNVTRKNMRVSLNIEEKFVIGHVGSFTYPKNHDFIINVFKELQKKNDSAVLLLIGSGELDDKIKEQITFLGLEDKVILVGSVINVNEYMYAMDVFFFPSIFEGLGIAVIEAQATGLQCIVSNSLPEEVYITNLVESYSTNDEIEFWIRSLLNTRERDRKSFNKKVISAGYDIKNTAKEVQELYLSFIK